MNEELDEATNLTNEAIGFIHDSQDIRFDLKTEILDALASYRGNRIVAFRTAAATKFGMPSVYARHALMELQGHVPGELTSAHPDWDTVYNVFSHDLSVYGLSVTEVADRLKADGFTVEDVKDACEHLVVIGWLHSTIDEEHFKHTVAEKFH